MHVGVVHVLDFLRGKENAESQGNNAADGTHQVDDRVGLGAERLDRNIRHKGDGRRAENRHSDQHGHQCDDKIHQGVDERQQREQRDGDNGADQNKRSAASEPGVAFIRQLAEKRQHEKSENVVNRHNTARERLGHVELVRQHEWNNRVIRLPEHADQEERHTRKKCPFVIELDFHLSRTFLRSAKERRNKSFTIIPYSTNCVNNFY